MSNKKSVNTHCKLCDEFEVLRYPASDKLGIAICNKSNMILQFQDVMQFEELKCGLNVIKDKAN